MDKIKVLGISGSPRVRRNTERLVAEILEEAERNGAEAELFSMSGKTLTPCIGCNLCRKGKECKINDDITTLLQKIEEADVIVLGSPVFFYGVSSQFKIFMDRTYAKLPIGEGKVAVCALTAGSVGVSDALNNMMLFMGAHGMTYAGYVAFYGTIRDKEKAVASAHDLARKAIDMAKHQKTAPEGTYRMVNHYAYGTHTL